MRVLVPLSLMQANRSWVQELYIRVGLWGREPLRHTDRCKKKPTERRKEAKRVKRLRGDAKTGSADLRGGDKTATKSRENTTRMQNSFKEAKMACGLRRPGARSVTAHPQLAWPATDRRGNWLLCVEVSRFIM